MERNPQLESLMSKFGIDQEEAELLIEFDKMNANTPKPVQATQKRTQAAPAKPKTKNTKGKSATVKESVFLDVLSTIENSELTSGLQSLKANSITFADADGNYYTLALTAHKAAPNGYQL